MELRLQPLTPDIWPAFEDLFESGSTCKRCWCMYWRIGSAYRRQPSEANRTAFLGIVTAGPPPGLVAFEGDTAVGWCQLSSRDSVPWLDRNAQLKRVDEQPVWSISCFYVRKGYRKRGVTAALIGGALDAARVAGVAAVEAYPLDREFTPSSSSTGFASTFVRLGFVEVGRRLPGRPIFRYLLAR